ncbi:WD40-repeat-containing domain protein, partial [Dactylonectria macrodidyma]
KDQKCLRDLRVINPKTQKTTIQKTKGGLLKDAYRWILDHADFCRFREDPESRLLWIKGDPGKGKTMLLCGIIDELQKESSQTISYFFCQATQDHQLRNATAVLRSLIWLLCSSQPHLTSHVRKRYDEEGKDLFVDVSAFSALEEILQEILEDPSLEDAVFIIDAMDECSEETRTELIDLVVRFSESCHAKWIVSSRNWPAIEEQFEVADKVKVSLELNKDAVSKAVDIFIDSKVDHLARVKRYDAKTKETVYDTLRQKANDTFLWVALVCTELARPNIRSWNTMDTLYSIPEGLEKLYERMFEYTLNCVDAAYCRQILATTCITFRPIAFDELRVLVKALEDFNTEQLEQMIGECGSFLTLEEGIVYFVHQSAQDFLLKQADDTFPTSIKGQNCLIFRRSLEVLTELKRNPYRLQSPGVLINEISRPDPDPLAHFQYSCVHWVDHLEQADDERNTSDVEKIVQFVEARLLYWLEALSLLGKMSEGAHAVQKLKSMMQNVNHEALQSLIEDVRRFVLAYRHVLEIAPLQVYLSALVFCPTGSLVKKLFQREEVNWIDNISNIPEHWDACIQTLEGRLALAVAFSPDDRRLALCFVDNSIRIWDTVSSNYVQVIEPLASPRDVPQSVAYSPGEQCLAIGLGDGTIEIWDLDSARRIQQIQAHQDTPVQDLAFSPDGMLLASCARGGVKLMHLAITDSIPTMRARDDDEDNPWSISFVAGDLLATGLEGGAVQVWDIQSGTCVKMIQSPNKGVLSVALSSDGQLLASSVHDSTVKIWDLTLDSDADLDNDYRFGLTNLIIFSPDGRWIASYQYSGPVEIWDSLKGTCITTLDVSRINEGSPVFSADGQWFLSMSSQHTKLWKTADWTCVKTWGPTRFCVFSPDSRFLGLVLFGLCIVWDVTVESTIQKLDDSSLAPRWFSGPIVLSKDSRWLAVGTLDKTRVWSTESGTLIYEFDDGRRCGRNNLIEVNSKWLVCTTEQSSIKVRDMRTGTLIAVVYGTVTIGAMWFDPANDSRLHTCMGTIDIDTQTIRRVGYGISEDGEWILKGSMKFLWIPSEYRSAETAIRGATLVIQCDSGRIV